MSLIHSENWDSATAPAIPAGWNVPTQITTTTSGPTPVSSPNMVFIPAALIGTFAATWGTPDTVSGNVVVTGTGCCNITAGAKQGAFAVFARSGDATTSYTTSTFIEAKFSFNIGTLFLNTIIAGSLTTLASVTGLTISGTVFYQTTLSCFGSSISVQVQRLSDGFWLTSAGAFQSGVATAISVSSSAVTGAGYAGWAASDTGSVAKVYGDDWSFSSLAALPVTGQPVYPDFARSVSQIARPGGWVCPPPPTDISMPAQPRFPDRALPAGSTRTSSLAYQVVLSGNLTGDGNPPNGEVNFQDRISWPGRTAAPGRTANTAYQAGQTLPAEPDTLMPARPSYPDVARTYSRSTADTYAGVFKQTEIPSSTLMGSPITFPDKAPGPKRQLDYTFTLLPAPGDPIQPSGQSVYQDRISWPSRTARASVQAYHIVNPGPGNVIPPISPTPIVPVFPDAARGPVRAGIQAYVGLLGVPEIGDVKAPVGRPVLPDRVSGSVRAGSVAYAGLLSSREPDGSVAPGHPVFPDRTLAAPRAANVAYAAASHVQPADRRMPSIPHFPLAAPGPRRSTPDAYAPPQPLHTNPAAATAGHPVFPDQVRPAARSVPLSYQGLLSRPALADARQPHGRQVYPAIAPGPRRAQQEAYVVYVHPGGVDLRMPSAVPVYPHRAPVSPRTSFSAYAGLLSQPVHSDSQSPAQAFYSLPSRSAARATPDAYRGLASAPALADARLPHGRPVYPVTAPAPRRGSQSTYQVVNRGIPTSQVFVLSVSSGIRFTAYVSDGPTYVLSVSCGINFTDALDDLNNRHRYGDLVPFVFAAPPGTMLTPNPTLTITQDGTTIGTFPLWTWDGGATFQAWVLLNQLFALGRLIGSTVLLTTTGAYQMSQVLDLVAGGDVGSTVIAVYAHEGVSGRTTLAQLRSGELVQGSDPWITS